MYPVGYEADYVEPRNRLRVGFRFILAIPWLILAQYIYPIAIFVVAVIAWFALLFTARYPKWAYDFNAGFLRMLGRVNGFLFLQTDEWPPFGFEEAPQYPIRIPIAPAQERYSRWRAFFRLIVGIPVIFVAALIGYVGQTIAVLSWFVIVFTGRQPAGLHNVLSFALAYSIRATAYFLLMTERFPPVSDQGVAPSSPPPSTPPPRPAPAATSAPAASNA
jgi:hypothetical protein